MKLKIDYGRDGLEIEVPESAPVLQMAAGAGLGAPTLRGDHGR